MAKYGEELSQYELLRLRNIEENKQMMKELGILNDEAAEYGFGPVQKKLKLQRRLSLSGKEKSKKPELVIKKKRRSQRLTPKQELFTPEVARSVLGDINHCYVSLGDRNDNCDSENSSNVYIIPIPEKKPQGKSQMVGDREIPSVDEITDDDLERIAEKLSDKVHSQDGTTCHQCRQKTEDQKTICRSSQCFGVRGQFCGPCLKNRYGESAATSLKDPEWTCPPCRNICNCSICRTHAGKLPTGQLTHFAQQQGYDSVKHLLDAEDEN